jgi:hypothetical protein
MVLLKAYIFKSENNLKAIYSYNMERNQDKDSEGPGPDPDKLLFYKFIIIINFLF